jgi:hypothetical protein
MQAVATEARMFVPDISRWEGGHMIAIGPARQKRLERALRKLERKAKAHRKNDAPKSKTTDSRLTGSAESVLT